MKAIDIDADEREKYRGFRVTEMHAIMAVDPQDDSEGIPAFMTPDGPMPMIASDRVRLGLLIEMAQQVADARKMNFKIVKFSVREDVGEIKARTLS